MKRVRGSRRNKIDKAIREAGYIRTYSTKSYNINRTIKVEPGLDLLRLAENMGKDKINDRRSFAKRYRDNNGISIDIATEIIEYLNKNHNSNLKINFDDYYS